MQNPDYKSLRREFLGVGLTGSMIALAGCADSVNIETPSDDDNSAGDSASQPDIDTARFNFEYDADAQKTTIEFTGGTSITAGNLRIQQDGGKEILWPELGSTTAGSDEQIEPGDTAELGPNILNWEVPIDSDDTIRLIYIGKDAPATLERFTPPESTNTTTTVPASIDEFRLETQSDQQLRVSFTSTSRLETLDIRISGAESQSLTITDMVEDQTGPESYSYEATTQVSSEGSYTATVAEAIDENGNDSTRGQSISDTASFESSQEDTTPPSINAFSIANPSGQQLRISFDSTEELNSIRVSIFGPESVDLTTSDFTQTATEGDQISYEATYQPETDGEYTANLVEAADSAGNDGATGAEVSVTIENSSDSNNQMLIGDDFETDHNMEPYRLQTGVSDDYDWGTTQANVPGDGSHVGWIYENDSGQRTVAIATSNETVDWNTTHEFNFMVRCTEYSQNTPWNSVDISWRGGIISEEGEGQEEETTLRLSVFSTDGSENPRPFQWGGKGVVDAGEGYNIEWETSTWYNIRGYVDQESGAAEAKIWKNSEPEPENYQINATVSTESANNLPYSINVDARTGSPIRFEMAHLRWSDMESSSQSSGFDPFTVTIDGRATYLTKDSTDNASPEPAIISLSDRGISEGDEIEFEVSGLWTQSSDEEPNNCRSNGVFSQTSELLAIDRSHRVPGAIDAGEDVETNNTYNADRETNIPEDFSISSMEDGECSRKKTITVPEDAEYLFIGVRDSAYTDNSGELEINIRPA